MQTLTEIRSLLAEQGVQPKHRLGQNFLHDQNQLRKLIDAADIQSEEVALEVGPGTGTLTEALLERGAIVIACEIDHDMAAIVHRRLGDASGRLTLIRGDAMAKGRSLNPEVVEAIDGRPFRLIANLPYQVASTLITTLLIDHTNCLGQFVTIQKEVADRLAAAPSTDAFGPLSVITQAFGDVRRICTLSASCFWPEPEVTSAMVAITPRESPEVHGREFARFVTDLFTRRRKQLGTIIGRSHAAWPALIGIGVTLDLRPEALSVAQQIEVWRAMHERG